MPQTRFVADGQRLVSAEFVNSSNGEPIKILAYGELGRHLAQHNLHDWMTITAITSSHQWKHKGITMMSPFLRVYAIMCAEKHEIR